MRGEFVEQKLILEDNNEQCTNEVTDKNETMLMLEDTINIKNSLISEFKEKEVENRNVLVKKVR